PSTGQTTLPPVQAALLGHLIGDGCTLPRHAIQYTTREFDLANMVADLAREVFGGLIVPRVERQRQWYQVYLASAVRLTQGKHNPVTRWLTELGVFGLRSHEKWVPEPVFHQSPEIIGTFLRHLWSTDGCVRPPANGRRHPAVYYASSSERLARDVQTLLLHLGINAVLRTREQGTKGRPQYHVMVMGRDDLLAFAGKVGAVGEYKSSALRECVEWMKGRKGNTNRDVIPFPVWGELAIPAMRRNGVTMRALQSSLGMAFMGTGLYKQNVSRERAARVAAAVGGDPRIALLADSDVYWDEVREVRPDGTEEVFDLTVPGPANFLANGIIAHNSIEQDADTCLLLHRPGRYDGATEDNVIEVIVAKQRNGPTGEVTLTYLKQFMRYENYAPEHGFGM
ncbi:MAG TPA: LAGLIDADG family homing endonuclease, partial [Gemmataceae bacterium]